MTATPTAASQEESFAMQEARRSFSDKSMSSKEQYRISKTHPAQCMMVLEELLDKEDFVPKESKLSKYKIKLIEICAHPKKSLVLAGVLSGFVTALFFLQFRKH